MAPHYLPEGGEYRLILPQASLLRSHWAADNRRVDGGGPEGRGASSPLSALPEEAPGRSSKPVWTISFHTTSQWKEAPPSGSPRASPAKGGGSEGKAEG